MAAVSRADVVWEGDLGSGNGRVKVASGVFEEFPVTWAARAERQHGKTSPEELLAAAHASCYSMAFSNGLSTPGPHGETLAPPPHLPSRPRPRTTPPPPPLTDPDH